MTASSNIMEVAESHESCVYAFYRLCKLHKVGTGKAADFFALPQTLYAQESFRSDFFRLLASIKSSQDNLSQGDMVTIVALAMGGSEVSQLSALEVPESMMELLTAGSTGTHESAAQRPTAADVQEPQADYNSALIHPSPRSAKPNTSSAHLVQTSGSDGTLLPDLSQIVSSAHTSTTEKPLETPANLNVATDQEPTGGRGTDPQLSEKLERLESSRIAIESRLEQIEQRLADIPKAMRGNDNHPRPGAAPPPPRIPLPESRQNLLERHPAGPGRWTLIPGAPNEHTPHAPKRTDTAASSATYIANKRSVSDAEHPPEIPPLSSRVRGLGYPSLILCILLILGATVATRLYFSYSLPSTNTMRHLTAASAPPSIAVDNSSLDESVAAIKAASKHPAARASLGDEEDEKIKDVTDTLLDWASAASNNDVVTETSFYAPRLKRYFLQRNVSREYVGNDKRAYRERGNVMQSLKISDLSFQFSSDAEAIVSLSKTWSVLGPSQREEVHTGRSRLWLRRTPGGWKIVGEQDLKALMAGR